MSQSAISAAGSGRHRERAQEERLVASWRRYLGPDADPLIHQMAAMQAELVCRTLGNEGVGCIAPNDAYGAYAGLLEGLFGAARCRLGTLAAVAPAVIVVSPHLGFSKLMAGRFGELLAAAGIGLKSSVPNSEPWFWRHLGGWAVARATDAVLVPVEMRYGHPIADLQDGYGAIALNTARPGGAKGLVAALRLQGGRAARVVFSMFPEGGSTGKRAGSGQPFRLEPFRTGFVVAAKRSHMPVLPMAHVVDPAGYSHLHALEPIWMDSFAAEHEACEFARERMQKEIRLLLADVTGHADACA